MLRLLSLATRGGLQSGAEGCRLGLTAAATRLTFLQDHYCTTSASGAPSLLPSRHYYVPAPSVTTDIWSVSSKSKQLDCLPEFSSMSVPPFSARCNSLVCWKCPDHCCACDSHQCSPLDHTLRLQEFFRDGQMQNRPWPLTLITGMQVARAVMRRNHQSRWAIQAPGSHSQCTSAGRRIGQTSYGT